MARFPQEILTPRLRLRPPRAGDGEMVNQAILESFSALSTWMKWAKQRPTVDQSEAFARDHAVKYQAATYNNGDEATLLMLRRETGDFVGATGMPNIDWDVPSFEIGYWCRTSEVGKGYVTESTYAIAKMLFETFGANRVEVRMDDRNERSWRVAQRLGFTLEAVLKRDSVANDGSLRDTRIYAAFALEELTAPPSVAAKRFDLPKSAQEPLKKM